MCLSFYSFLIYPPKSICTFRFLYLHLSPPLTAPTSNLYILAHHGNHEIEKTNSLDESETQNGV